MDSTSTSIYSIQKRPFLVVLLLAIVVNIAGIGIKYYTDDPALYSILARNMAQSNNFTDLIYQGHDWLDKPHFPFWIAAVSFKIFGINTIAYKLPALLFFFLSVFYTYKIARKFYDLETALIAILILLTAQHALMSNTDVRAEPYIMGLLMGSIYHYYKVKERFSWRDILLASFFAACAVMTKGIYVLIPIGSAIIGDYLFKKDIKSLFHWKWLLGFVLVVIFTLPEIYTLYVQFDLHPEKVVFGRTGISGIHWFLWDSQFGRFNNNGYIRNTHGSIFFFMHTLLWAFAPWAIVFFYALLKNIRDIIKGTARPEYVTISGAVVMLLIFSISKFQLPFYTNIIFPLFAIITAVFVRSLTTGAELKFFKIVQYILIALLLLLITAVNIVFVPGQWLVYILLTLALALVAWLVIKSAGNTYQIVFLLTCAVAIWVNAYLVTVVYPTLVTYKGDVMAAEYLNKNYPTQPVVATFVSNSFNFYTHQPVAIIDADSLAKQKTNAVIFTDDKTVDEFKKKGISFKIVHAFEDYQHENLKLPFIIQSERSTVLDHYFLIRME